MNSISLENLTYLPSWSHESSAVTNSRQHSNILVKMGRHHDLGIRNIANGSWREYVMNVIYVGQKRHMSDICYGACYKLILNLRCTFLCLECSFV
jgi:hypothetical protein